MKPPAVVIARERGGLLVVAAGLALLLHGCASGPGSSRGRDGPPNSPPSSVRLDQIPDAEPRLESIRQGGPNKPYAISGRRYVPMTSDEPFTERGLASWYGTKFHNQSTSSGEPYDMFAMTAAHPTLPIPSYARIRNPANGREVIVRINDRGPFYPGRIVDLSYTAAYKLGVLRGVAPVELERITYEDIRTGQWRRPGDADTRLAKASAPATPNPERTAAIADAVATPVAASSAAPLPATVPVEVNESSAGVIANPVNVPSDQSVEIAAIAAATPPATATSAASAPNAGLDVVSTINPAAPPETATSPAPGFWVQLGAFRQRTGADALQRRTASAFDWISPLLGVFSDRSLYRVQAGPYSSMEEAQRVGRELGRVLEVVPMVVERR